MYDVLANEQEAIMESIQVFHLENRNNRNTHNVIARSDEEAYEKLANALHMDVSEVKRRYKIGASAPLKDVLARVDKAAYQSHFHAVSK